MKNKNQYFDMKKTIKITENDIRQIVSESVRRIVEANRKSSRRYTLEKDDAFNDELYKQATEEAKRNYNDYLEENWETLQRHLKWGTIDHIPTFEEWMHKYGPRDFYIRGIVKRYKQALKDNVTQIFDDEDYYED